MSPKERVIQQIKHKQTDFSPYTIEYEEEVREKLNDYYGGDFWESYINNHILAIPNPLTELKPRKIGENIEVDIYGTKWRTDLKPMHIVEVPLKEPSLKGYKMPDLKEIFKGNWKEKYIGEIEEKKDYFLVTGFGMGIFERSWSLRGFENVLMDCVVEPLFYQELVEMIADFQIKVIEKLVELPVDGIMFSDDWGYQRGVIIGPDRWRKFIKPHLAKMYSLVHESGKYVLSHCCGNIIDIIPDLIEIGLDVLQSVQPEAMNPYYLKKEFGKYLTFWGGLGSQSIIPFGKPDEIKREVFRLCNEMGRGGGYILGLSKPLLPETPVENAAAVIEAFLEQSGVKFGKNSEVHKLRSSEDGI